MGFFVSLFRCKAYLSSLFLFFGLLILVFQPVNAQNRTVISMTQALDSIEDSVQKAKYISAYPFNYTNDELIPYYEYGLTLYKKSEQPDLFLTYTTHLGLLYLNQLNYPKSIFYLSLAAIYYPSDSSSQQLVTIYKYRAQAYRFWGFSQQSIIQYQKAIFVANEINDSLSLCALNRELGYAFFMQEHDSSLYYYSRSNDIAKKKHSIYNLAYNYTMIGDCFHQKAKYSHSIAYHDTALKYALEFNQSKNNDQMLMFAYSGLGRSYFSLNNIDSAKKFFKITEKYMNGKLSINFYKELTDFYYNIGDYTKALEMADSTCAKSGNLKDAKYSIITNKLYIKIYKKLNNNAQVNAYYQKLISSYDSIYLYQSSDIVNSIKLFADIDKIANEKILLQKEKEIAQVKMEQTKNRSTIKSIIAIFLLVVIIIIGFLIIKYRKINRRLKAVINQLKQTQEQLINSEKMASIGVMAAGVAHEINNPVNFISAGINSLELDLNDLKQFIDLSSHPRFNKLSAKEKIIQLGKLQKEVDIQQTSKIINETVEDIKFGVVRTTDIVKSLLNLARMDDKLWIETDLNKSLNDAINILHNKVKYKAKVIKKFQNDKNIIFCMPGRINQVFVNIINNAVDAIDKDGVIIIESRADDYNAIISISDTGNGMTPETIKKAFDPFYTTKEIGKGTGLGLSISYGIIKEHKGDIRIESVVSKGSEILLTLPKRQKAPYER